MNKEVFSNKLLNNLIRTNNSIKPPVRELTINTCDTLVKIKYCLN